MKKILGLSIAAILVLGIVAAGTWAFFQDTETAATTMSAGTLDLRVDGTNAQYDFIVGPLKPGEKGNRSVTLNNEGNLGGNLTVGAGTVSNNEGTSTEFEDPANAPGELGGFLNIALFIDVDNDGNYTDGTDIGLKTDGSIYISGSLQYASVDSYAGVNWVTSPTAGPVKTIAAKGISGDSVGFGIAYDFAETVPPSNQNVCQGDSLSVLFTFTLTSLP